MANKIVLLIIIVISVFLTSCSSMAQLTSGAIGCEKNQITIENESNMPGGRSWTAVCKGKKYLCTTGINYNSANCSEKK